MNIGYARTSTLDQTAGYEAQLRALEEAGCNKVFQEQVSSVAQRAQLDAALDFMREGDTLIVTQLDRLAQDAGGDIRDFFRLIKDCLVRASSAAQSSLSVSDNIVNDAENQLRREMLPVPREDAAWLRRIAKSKQPELETMQKLPDLARFFDTHVVINYRNNEDWYDIHPLLEGFLEP